MIFNGIKSVKESWGKDLRIQTLADFNFIPGVFGLFNSLIAHGFEGVLDLYYTGQEGEFRFPDHPQLNIKYWSAPQGRWCPTTVKVFMWQEAVQSPGQYLFLDADIIVTRPLGDILSRGDFIVSVEEESKYDPYDIQIWHQCQSAGLSFDVPSLPYINSGFLYYSSRQKEVIERCAGICKQELEGHLGVFSHPAFFFNEQDVLNVVVRNALSDGYKLDIATSDEILIGSASPSSNLPYLIHGAAQKRPWRDRGSGLRKILKSTGLEAFLRKKSGRMGYYELAWGYYTCNPSMAIPPDIWIDAFEFYCSKRSLWRYAHGLL